MCQIFSPQPDPVRDGSVGRRGAPCTKPLEVSDIFFLNGGAEGARARGCAKIAEHEKKPRRPKAAGARARASEGRVPVELGLARAARGGSPAEELDVVGDDLVAVALNALAIRPLAVVEPAADRDEHPL